MRNKKVAFLAQAAMIGALYVALVCIFAPISFGAIQFRIAEALTILPVFTPAAIPGLFVGCVLGNILGGAAPLDENGLLWEKGTEPFAAPLDVVFGSLATLIGAFFTWTLRNAHPFLAPVPPILANTLIIPFVLRYAYGIPDSIPFLMLTVCIGEVIACGLLGLLLYYALRKSKTYIFRSHES